MASLCHINMNMNLWSWIWMRAAKSSLLFWFQSDYVYFHFGYVALLSFVVFVSRFRVKAPIHSVSLLQRPFPFRGFSLSFFWSMKNRWENNLCAIFDNIIERKSLWERVFGFHFYFNFFLVLCSFIWFFRSENQWRKYFSFTKKERRFHYYQIQKHCVCARIWWWWWW